jgi:hypothetical protein
MVLGLLLALGIGSGAWLYLTRPAELVISSTPLGAQISINGELQITPGGGEERPLLTPARLQLPDGGAAQVSLELPDFERYTTRVRYKAGEMVKLEPALKAEPKEGNLEVVSVPSGAAILLNGKKLDRVTPARLENLPVGRYDLRIELNPFQPATATIEVKKGATASFTAPLVAPPTPIPGADSSARNPTGGNTSRPPAEAKPATPAGPPGTLVVSAVPPDCTVYIDGARRGTAPVTAKLSPGNHRVRLERFDGSTAKEFSAMIKSNEETTRVWDMEGRQFISE